jgi:hypothetical protein
MAYAAHNTTSPNPPLLVGDQPIAGPRTFQYTSSHTRAVVVASTHITDGKTLGMKVGDHIYVHETSVNSNESSDIERTSFHRVTRVESTWVTLNIGALMSSAS